MRIIRTAYAYSAITLLACLLVSCGSSSSSDSDSNLPVLNTDALLSDVTIDGIELGQTFEPTQNSYTASVGFLTRSINLLATVNDSAATITVNSVPVSSGSETSSIALAEGENLISVVVTAEDEETINTYTIEVNRAVALDEDVLLSDLTVDGAELDQTFQATQSSYTASVHFLIGSISLLPVTTDNAASITVNGTPIVSSSDFISVALAEGDNLIDIAVTKEGATSYYTVEVSRETSDDFAQQAYLKASNAEGNDNFGYSIAASEDTVVVGAYNEDGDSASTASIPNEGRTVSGAAYVFVRDGDSWTQQAYLKANDSDAGDNFGFTVAVSGDTVVVGAVGEDGDSTSTSVTSNNNAPGAGAAYVFTRDGAIWTQQAYLKANNAVAEDRFGRSVAVSGDALVVGARNEGDSGAAYVFARVGTSWTQQAYLKASNADAGDQFGHSVGVSGNTIVVGADDESGNIASTASAPNNGATQAGAAYVFIYDGTNWIQQAYLKASNAGAFNKFGSSVAVSGDTVVVGARDEGGDSNSTASAPNNNLSNAGAVYVFTRDGTSWTQQAYLKAGNAETSDGFGIAVAVSGDTLVVGATSENGDSSSTMDNPNNDAVSAGAAYVFTRAGISWTQQAYLKASNVEASDAFGQSVAVSGDTVVVGANEEDSSATGGESDNSESESGAVYVWQ